MLGAPGLQLESDLDLVDVQLSLRPFVDDVEDVGVGRSQLGQQPGQRTGPVGDPDAEGQVAPAGRHAVPDDAEQQQRIDVATGQHGDDRRLERRRVGENRGDTGSTRRLDDELGPLEQQHQRPGEPVLADGDDVVAQRLDQPEGHLTGQATAIPSAMVVMVASGTGLPASSDGG